MDTGWASALIHLWVLCVLNMPSMTRKRRGFTLGLAIETKRPLKVSVRILLYDSFIFGLSAWAFPYSESSVNIFSQMSSIQLMLL